MMDQMNMRDTLGDGEFFVNGTEFDDTPTNNPFMNNEDSDIDKLLNEETNNGSFNLNDSELLNLMSHEQSSIPGSDIALNNVAVISQFCLHRLQFLQSSAADGDPGALRAEPAGAVGADTRAAACDKNRHTLDGLHVVPFPVAKLNAA